MEHIFQKYKYIIEDTNINVLIYITQYLGKYLTR